jgi:hypothetical protein
MRDDSAFLCETFDVSRLRLKIAERNKQREVSVFVAGGLEHGVQLPLDILPDPVSPRFDYHATSNIRILREVGGTNDLLIPLGKVIGPSGRDSGSRS